MPPKPPNRFGINGRPGVSAAAAGRLNTPPERLSNTLSGMLATRIDTNQLEPSINKAIMCDMFHSTTKHTDTDTNTVTNTNTDTDSDTSNDTGTDTDTDCDKNIHPCSYVDPKALGLSPDAGDTETDTGTNTKIDTDSDTSNDTGPDTDTDNDRNIHPSSYVDPTAVELSPDAGPKRTQGYENIDISM